MNSLYRGRHGNFYFAWKPPIQIEDEEFFRAFVGEKAIKTYNNASADEKSEIIEMLKNMEGHRSYLNNYFKTQRGGVTLISDSPAPPNTESSEEMSETESEEAWESSSGGETESSEEISETRSEESWESSSGEETESSEEPPRRARKAAPRRRAK